MPSPLYIKLLATTGPYVDAKKAEEVIARQLAKCGATADTFAATHLEAIKLLISGALGLYVPDAGKRDELVGKLKPNTLIIVTSDNGMAFPRAKADCYEFGIHMPLAISWPERVPAARAVDDLIGLVDLTATILDAANVSPDATYGPSGRSILDILKSDQQGVLDASRDAVYSARERHSSSRYNNWTYPQRSLRTRDYLYIRNFKPDRWPAGDPQKYGADGKLGPMHGGYHDIDACPSLTFLVDRRDDPEIRPFFLGAVDKRPAEELFDIHKDPSCLVNLADDPALGETRRRLAAQLEEYLRTTGDPRVVCDGDVWESYKRYSAVRKFPEPPETF